MSTATWFGAIGWTLVVCLCLQGEAGLAGVPSWLEGDRCYSFDLSLCRSYGYNQTAFPNSLGQRTEMEAVLHLGAFVPLMESGCSDELRFLLCMVYLPVCLRDPNNGKLLDIQPCRQLCQRVHRRCERTARKLRVPWPSNVNCATLPDAKSEDDICFNEAPKYRRTEETLLLSATESTASFSHTRYPLPSKDDDSNVLMIAVATAGWCVCSVVITIFIIFVCWMRRQQSDNKRMIDLANRRPSVASDVSLLTERPSHSVKLWINEVSNSNISTTSHHVDTKRQENKPKNGTTSAEIAEERAIVDG